MLFELIKFRCAKYLSIVCLIFPFLLSATTTVQVTYLANEGVMVSVSGTKVLFDGLHHPYKPAYASLSGKDRQQIEAALPPFDHIQYLFFTHMHGDHFSAQAAGNYMLNNSSARLLAAPQLVDLLQSQFNGYEKISKRIITTEPDHGMTDTLTFSSITVYSLGIRHGSQRHSTIQHRVYLVDIGGLRLLHLGDAIMDRELFTRFDWATLRVDLAFVPFWFFEDSNGQFIVNELIKPPRIFAMHISPQENRKIVASLKNLNPAIIPLIRPLQQFNFEIE